MRFNTYLHTGRLDPRCSFPWCWRLEIQNQAGSPMFAYVYAFPEVLSCYSDVNTPSGRIRCLFNALIQAIWIENPYDPGYISFGCPRLSRHRKEMFWSIMSLRRAKAPGNRYQDYKFRTMMVSANRSIESAIVNSEENIRFIYSKLFFLNYTTHLTKSSLFRSIT